MAYSKTTWKNRVVQNPQTYLQQQNADGTVTLIPKEGTVTEAGTPVNAVNMNNIENGISVVDAENSIYDAGGTANTITVATTNGDYSYAQFKRLSIKAASDNTGNVTINVDGKGAVPALKYDKNQIPAGGIKAGKVYDFYYDTANTCFFLIAKASGNAVAADVLAGKTFSNDTDSGIVGTLEKKQDIGSYLINNPPSPNYYSINGYVEGEGLWISRNCYDTNGNIVKQLTKPVSDAYCHHVTKNHAVFFDYNHIYLVDKNGNTLQTISEGTNTTGTVYFNESLNWVIYAPPGSGIMIYNTLGTLLYSNMMPSNFKNTMGIIPISNGILVFFETTTNYNYEVGIINSNGIYKKISNTADNYINLATLMGICVNALN